MRAKKHFGQHFLCDTQIIAQLLQAIHPQATQHMVEIGPGPGVLTRALVTEVKRLDVVEIDTDMLPGLQQLAQTSSALQVHHQDALTFELTTLATNNLRLVGNLPYNISTPLLFHLLRQKSLIHDMYFMLQKEVVERICAQPGSKVYGRLSVMLQYHCQATRLFYVPASAFAPPPKVESAVVKLVPYPESPYPTCDESLLETVVRTAFGQRRKTLRNNLRSYAIDFAKLGIDPQVRAEQLAVGDYVALVNYIGGINER